MSPDFLKTRIDARRDKGLYRQLRVMPYLTDFCSNDYLGLVKNKLLRPQHETTYDSGSTGSRLLTGNHELFASTEKQIADFHDAEAALIFNSGYDANTGLLSCIASKGDTILYDALSHASIRDGIRLSVAESWSFAHNDIEDLRLKIQKAHSQVFVVTESVFSMDGDEAPLSELVKICNEHNACLIVDEAHAAGVSGDRGEGLCQFHNVQRHCLARIYTYGKAFGCHGAAIVGSSLLMDYLVNFCRPFIYSTAMSPASVHDISTAYSIMPSLSAERKQMKELIQVFRQSQIPYRMLHSNSAIQGVVVPGNENVRKLSEHLQIMGFDVRPILYPTVPTGSERLRIILHSYNTVEEVKTLTEVLRSYSADS